MCSNTVADRKLLNFVFYVFLTLGREWPKVYVCSAPL